jgi:two-component system, LytTR family, sensor kinase
LRFVVSVENTVRECMVPAFILQPLVENAIRHGIGKHKGSDTVTIRGFREGEFLSLEVSNLNSRLDQPDSARNGIGLTNTRSRLEQLYGQDHELRLSRLAPNGVCAGIRIPLRSSAGLLGEAAP